MPAEDKNIYGLDDTALAEGIANACLKSTSGDAKASDSRADSSGGMKNDPVNDVDVSIASKGKGSDSRAKSEGNQ